MIGAIKTLDIDNNYNSRDILETNDLDEDMFIDVDIDFATNNEINVSYDHAQVSAESPGVKKLHEIDLQEWSIRNRINHRALNGLLKLLKETGHQDLPRDAHTLLKTPRRITTVPVGDERYWHNGLYNSLKTVFKDLTESKNLFLIFNMDGVPIGRSTKKQFWPILCLIDNIPEIKPLIIGIYEGESKPLVIQQFLSPLVAELNDAIHNGFKINDHTIHIKIKCFICDTPARAFIKGTNISHLNTSKF